MTGGFGVTCLRPVLVINALTVHFNSSSFLVVVRRHYRYIGGVDYDDTYAPVAKLASSHVLIAMANRLGLILHQIDIKGAYLNGTLRDDEVLYLRQPPGYAEPGAGTRVL